jgi:hypothetical protein
MQAKSEEIREESELLDRRYEEMASHALGPKVVALDKSTLEALAELAGLRREQQIDATKIVADVEGRLEAKLLGKLEAAIMPKVEKRLLMLLVTAGVLPQAILDEFERKFAPKSAAPEIADRVLGDLNLRQGP